jgi:hypothetical protein
LDVEVQNQRSLQALVRAVTLSQGEFSLILVRCNYAQLRDRILTRLQNCCPISIDILTLPESAKTLLTTLQTELGIRDGGLGIRDQVPRALFLFGMESLHDLDQVLIATNLVREELRRQFPFPLVLWANDDGLHKLERLAPDLYSWAGGIIQFDMPIPELVQSLKRHSDRLFSSILDLGDEQAVANWAIVPLAQEIAASGRQKDLDALLNRLALPKNKLIVLHGPSGVGKSSIVSGGLVPMLQEHLIGERTAIAVLLESYTDWQANLEKLLSQLPTGQVADPDASSDLLHRFRTLTDRNYLPILILDQFEEFFFVCKLTPG